MNAISMSSRMTDGRAKVALFGTLIAVAIAAYGAWRLMEGSRSDLGTTSANAEQSDASAAPARDRNSVDLSDSQLASVRVEPVEDREFPVEKRAVGSIDFNEYLTV